MAADRVTFVLIGGLFGLLLLGTGIVWGVKARHRDPASAATIANLEARVRGWWLLIGVFCLAVLFGPTGTLLLFAALSYFGLREFLALPPKRAAAPRAPWVMVATMALLHYAIVAHGGHLGFALALPFCSLVLLPLYGTVAGRATRAATGALLIAVYGLSHAPALLTVDGASSMAVSTHLLLFLVIVVQLSDVLQYVWGKLYGRRKIAPVLSPNKTWAGFVGGVLTASAVGAALWWATPFSPLQAGCLALAITLSGFAGGLVLSAIKRSHGVKDFGGLLPGHGGVLDRVDSLCFAAPVFFYLVRVTAT
jgi:phosphatidate cytidylyltransferase